MPDITKAGLAALNALPPDTLATHLRACCGSAKWVERMLARRPFVSADALLAANDEVSRTLAREDWLEAFAHHPRLGESRAAVAQDARASGWSATEQSGLSGAADDLRRVLAAANVAYEQRFGYICIICASGRDSDELLAITRGRLGNDPKIELKIAAEEQRKITRLRLQKLLRDLSGSDAR